MTSGTTPQTWKENYSVLVKGVPEHITEDEIRCEFSKFGVVRGSQLYPPQPGRKHGTAFIYFKSKEDATKAVQSSPINVANVNLHVAHYGFPCIVGPIGPNVNAADVLNQCENLGIQIDTEPSVSDYDISGLRYIEVNFANRSGFEQAQKGFIKIDGTPVIVQKKPTPASMPKSPSPPPPIPQRTYPNQQYQYQHAHQHLQPTQQVHHHNHLQQIQQHHHLHIQHNNVQLLPQHQPHQPHQNHQNHQNYQPHQTQNHQNHQNHQHQQHHQHQHHHHQTHQTHQTHKRNNGYHTPQNTNQPTQQNQQPQQPSTNITSCGVEIICQNDKVSWELLAKRVVNGLEYWGIIQSDCNSDTDGLKTANAMLSHFWPGLALSLPEGSHYYDQTLWSASRQRMETCRIYHMPVPQQTANNLKDLFSDKSSYSEVKWFSLGSILESICLDMLHLGCPIQLRGPGLRWLRSEMWATRSFISDVGTYSHACMSSNLPNLWQNMLNELQRWDSPVRHHPMGSGLGTLRGLRDRHKTFFEALLQYLSHQLRGTDFVTPTRPETIRRISLLLDKTTTKTLTKPTCPRLKQRPLDVIANARVDGVESVAKLLTKARQFAAQQAYIPEQGSSVSVEDRLALYLINYSTPFLLALNRVVGPAIENNTPLPQEWLPYICSIWQALERIPPTQFPVFRALPQRLDEKLYAPNTKLIWPGFAPATISPRIAHHLVAEDRGTVFVIYNSNARVTRGLSEFSLEQEALIPPFTLLQSLGKMDSNTKDFYREFWPNIDALDVYVLTGCS